MVAEGREHDEAESLLGNRKGKRLTQQDLARSGRLSALAGRLIALSLIFLIGAVLLLAASARVTPTTARQSHSMADHYYGRPDELLQQDAMPRPPSLPPRTVDAVQRVVCDVLNPWAATVRQFAELSRRWHAPVSELCDYKGTPCDAFGPSPLSLLRRLSWPSPLEHMGPTSRARLVLGNSSIALQRFTVRAERSSRRRSESLCHSHRQGANPRRRSDATASRQRRAPPRPQPHRRRACCCCPLGRSRQPTSGRPSTGWARWAAAARGSRLSPCRPTLATPMLTHRPLPNSGAAW